MRPDKGLAPEATAIPKQSGIATRKTTKEEDKSSLRYLKVIGEVLVCLKLANRLMLANLPSTLF